MKHDRIRRDPEIMMGKPSVRGTRITVDLILRKFAAGMSTDDVMQAYPHLSEEDLRAALDYAADYMEHEGIIAAE